MNAKKMEHTPGPWRDRIATGVPDHLISGGYDAHQRNGEGICVIPFQYGEGKGTARRNANARLIAAAPALFQACQDMLKATDELMTEFISKQRAADWGIINHAMADAGAAIRAASNR